MKGDNLIKAKPIGTVIDTAYGDWGLATATFSSDRHYRYRLSRIWNHKLPRVNFIMCNPSTADALILDPTVRRCIGYGIEWGMGSCEVTNIFALRSTNPSNLYSATDPIGSNNDLAILAAAEAADLVIAAWGTHGAHLDRGNYVLDILENIKVNALKTTKAGHPSHPLYLPANILPFSLI
jgi:hypothetical protein